MERVLAHAGAGDLEAAARAVQEQIAGGRGSAADYLTLGHLQLRRHALEEALAAYERAADADPLLYEPHYFTGLAHRKAGRWQDAEAALRRASFLAPTVWQAAYLLATTYERLGRADEALREREHARRMWREVHSVTALTHPLFQEWFDISPDVWRSSES